MRVIEEAAENKSGAVSSSEIIEVTSNLHD